MVVTANVVAVVTGEWTGTSVATKVWLVVGLVILLGATGIGALGQ